MVEGGECGFESVGEGLFWLTLERLSPIAVKVHNENKDPSTSRPLCLKTLKIQEGE
jgi:hypothetical protein